MGIKLGNLDISSFKVGGADCSIYLGDTKLYPQSQPPHDYSQDYLTVRALGSGNVSWSGTSTSNTLSYSTDNGATWSSPSSDITVSVNSGDAVLFKGECTPSTSYVNFGIGRFSGTTANFDVEGNAMSLLYGDNFVGQTSLSGKNNAFVNLFNGCASLVRAENLSLLATTLATRCYNSMFYGCTSLETAPTLPATTLAEYCYTYMFYNCSVLTTAPELPAATLANSCYYYMFQGCTSLETAPTLPATTLKSDCYTGMFQGCTNLTTAPELPATTLANWCYYYMFYGCTSLETAPTLPATTLKSGCYHSMFYGCTNLSNITCLATDISESECTYDWVQSVAASGTFTTPSSTNWRSGTGGIPNGWTRVDYNE